MTALNLGAGNRIISGAVNHDLVRHREEIDVVWDLNNLPWPWRDNQFEFICARSIFEHLNISLLQAVDECWRIILPNGRAEIKLPYWNHEETWNDPTHRRGYGLGIFDVFDPAREKGQNHGFYTERKWHVVEVGYSNERRSSVIGILEVIK